ncbi:MAG TPA: hypothetical protein VE760_05090, partial [Acidimicrobiales bacterium]|nr:hypothetical protein [Acidimicrobiales bacterium]
GGQWSGRLESETLPSTSRWRSVLHIRAEHRRFSRCGEENPADRHRASVGKFESLGNGDAWECRVGFRLPGRGAFDDGATPVQGADIHSVDVIVFVSGDSNDEGRRTRLA